MPEASALVSGFAASELIVDPRRSVFCADIKAIERHHTGNYLVSVARCVDPFSHFVVTDTA